MTDTKPIRRVAIIGGNRPRLYWAMCAGQAVGAVPVPVYADAVAEEMAYVLAHAEVTLYAVDEGVLSLVGYKTPDPVPFFGAARSLKVATLESREALARVLDPFATLGLDKGLDGGSGGEGGARRDFRASAYWSPALVTDAVPPCISANPLTSASPIPRPPCVRSRLGSTCENMVNSRGSAAPGMPPRA